MNANQPSPQPAGTPAGGPAQSVAGSRRPWLAVLSIALGSFAFVTTEYMPVGVLPRIAESLDVTAGTAGLMTTTPGVIAALSAPLLLLAAGRINRRLILLMLSVLLVASNLLSATATSFTMMLLGRALLGVSLGGFWTVALGVTGQIVAEEDNAKAGATIFMGITLATVIGVPLGTLIAEFASWRTSFYATAGLALIALVAQVWLLPELAPRSAVRIADFRQLLARWNVWRSMALVALLFGAHFAAYTYIAPFLEGNAAMSGAWVTAILLGFGIVGFASNFGISAFVTRHLRFSLVAMTGLIMIALLVLPLAAHSAPGVVAVVFGWGIAYGAIPLGLSIWMQMVSPRSPEAGSALFVSTVQTAIALGSLSGGIVVDHAGIPAAMHLGAILSAGGLAVLASFVTGNGTLKSVLER